MKKRENCKVVVRSPGQLGYHWKASVRGNCVKWVEDTNLYSGLTSPKNLPELESAIVNGETEYKEDYLRLELEEVPRFALLKLFFAAFSVYDSLGNVLGRIASILVITGIAVGLFFLRSHLELPVWLKVIAILFLLLILPIVAWLTYNMVGSSFSKRDPVDVVLERYQDARGEETE